MPAFGQVLEAVVQAWTDRREEVTNISGDIAQHLQQVHELPTSSADDVTDHAVKALAPSFDQTHAGFGDAPKFPPSMVCEFLLRHSARTGDAEALLMAERTLEAMARGGIYDQLGGGFARYSVDERWDVPHFEKMLYDNALLLRVYTHWFRQTGSPLAGRVARETAQFMLGELGTDEGGLASALDADSDGEEGVFYVWSPEQLDDGARAPRTARSRETLRPARRRQLRGRHVDACGYDVDTGDPPRLDDVRRRLLAARCERTRPARDDKVVAAWNGLAVAGLAEAGVILDEPDLRRRGRAGGRLLVDAHLVDGRLRRVSRDGVVGTPDGVLEDYACVADGLLALFGATGEARWYDGAAGLVADDRDALLRRQRWLLRHRRRRRDTAQATAGPGGQRVALRTGAWR